MARSDRLKITYAGGASRFVIPFLNGLASQAETFEALDRRIELSLLDLDVAGAEPNVRYADLVARQTGLPICASATDDRGEALEASDWVMFGIGRREEWRSISERYKPRLLDDSEAGPFMAIEAAVYWPWARRFGSEMQRLCPNALFCTLANPTDVLAAAVAKACGLSSIGLCVEVPQLQHWLAYYLRVPYSDIEMAYIGLNHLGWVSRWTVAGEDGAPKLTAALPERMQDETWEPRTDWFVDVFRSTGYLRTGPYHDWPYKLEWTEERKSQRQRSGAALRKEKENRVVPVQTALQRDEMIREHDPTHAHPCASVYLHPSIRHTFGAIAAGLAGGSAGPVAIQVRNGDANPTMPADAWLELPTRIEKGHVVPQTVPPLPDWMTAELQALAHQRMLLAEWLATDDVGCLKRALMLWPNVATTDVLLGLCDELSRCLDRAL